jgi:hypothetical protein
MTIELTMLTLSVVLGLVQIVLSAQAKNLSTGYSGLEALATIHRRPFPNRWVE